MDVGEEGLVSVDNDVTLVGCANEEVEAGDATGGVHDTRNRKRIETISSFVFTFHLMFRSAAQRYGSAAGGRAGLAGLDNSIIA